MNCKECRRVKEAKHIQSKVRRWYGLSHCAHGEPWRHETSSRPVHSRRRSEFPYNCNECWDGTVVHRGYLRQEKFLGDNGAPETAGRQESLKGMQRSNRMLALCRTSAAVTASLLLTVLLSSAKSASAMAEIEGSAN